jgi:gamma-glutamylcyclotransferase (GGCT)/AIG2-like uncharacterized protein YtfP
MTTKTTPILLFVYGSMKNGFINHSILKDEKFIGNAVTINEYVMYPSNMYLFPYVCKNQKQFKIYGELFELINIDIKEIDIFERTPEMYYRQSIKVACNNKSYKAYIYFRTSSDNKGLDTAIPLNKWIKEFGDVGINNKKFLDSYIVAKQKALKQ